MVRTPVEERMSVFEGKEGKGTQEAVAVPPVSTAPLADLPVLTIISVVSTVWSLALVPRVPDDECNHKASVLQKLDVMIARLRQPTGLKFAVNRDA